MEPGDMVPYNPDEGIPTQQDIVKREGGEVLPSVESADKIAELKLRVQLAEDIRTVALNATRGADWIPMGDGMYLGHSGTTKLISLLGISFDPPQVEEIKEEYDGRPTIRFVCKLTGRCMGLEYSNEGTSSTTDPFFAKRRGQLLPLSEVDIGSVRKKAITNAEQRVVTGMLGLKKPDHTPTGVTSAGVSFDKPRPPQKPAQAPPQQPPNQMRQAGHQPPPEPRAPSQGQPQGQQQNPAEEIWAICLEMGFNDLQRASELLGEFGQWLHKESGEMRSGTRDYNKFKTKPSWQVEKVLAKARAAKIAWDAERAEAGRPGP